MQGWYSRVPQQARRWADVDLMKSSKGKCEVLYLAWKNPTQRVQAWGQVERKQLCRKDWRVLAYDLNQSQQRALEAKKSQLHPGLN